MQISKFSELWKDATNNHFIIIEAGPSTLTVGSVWTPKPQMHSTMGYDCDYYGVVIIYMYQDGHWNQGEGGQTF